MAGLGAGDALALFPAGAEKGKAAANLRKHGVVAFGGLWGAGRIDMQRARIGQSIPQLAEPAWLAKHHHKVGKGRFVVPLPLTAQTDCRDVILHPDLVALFDAALSETWVFEAIGLVVSLPGSTDQQIHRDGPPLYGDAGIDAILPAFALTVAIPLQPLDDASGSTAFWPGTHFSGEDEPDGEPVVLSLAPGSCLVWNFRTSHSGRANRTGEPRLLLYATVCRPFWIDAFNFTASRKRKLIVEQGMLDGLDENTRARFRRAEAP